jgi:uncharacterized membrane protein YeaQ/YmgE (transglycosylase-associated protein family)
MEEFVSNAEQWTNTILIWVGFGTVVGLIAKAIMPGRDQGGALATLMMGIAGTVVGMGILAYFVDGQRATPVSLLGFVTSVGGTFFLLLCNRVVQGSFFREEGTGPTTTALRGRRRRAAVVVHEGE